MTNHLKATCTELRQQTKVNSEVSGKNKSKCHSVCGDTARAELDTCLGVEGARRGLGEDVSHPQHINLRMNENAMTWKYNDSLGSLCGI